MTNFRRLLMLSVASAMAFPLLTACSDSDENQGLGELTPAEDVFGKANDVFSAEEWYPGGQLGTTEKASYSADAPAVDLIPGGNGVSDFITGEDFFGRCQLSQSLVFVAVGTGRQQRECHC